MVNKVVAIVGVVVFVFLMMTPLAFFAIAILLSFLGWTGFRYLLWVYRDKEE